MSSIINLFIPTLWSIHLSLLILARRYERSWRLRSPVGGDQNTGTIYLSVITSPKERGSIQHVKHKVYRIWVWCKQDTQGKCICNSVVRHESAESCFVFDIPRKPVSIGIRSLTTFLCIQYSRSHRQYWRGVYCLLLPPTRVQNMRQKRSFSMFLHLGSIARLID